MRSEQIRIIQYASSEYQQELNLRDEVLRKPLAMNLFSEDLSVDAHDIHIGFFSDEKLIGTLILSPKADYVKMRQVAVAVEARGKHIGSKLVQFSEQLAKQEGFTSIELNARETALEFYLKNGYSIVSEQFMEIQIPHYKMTKVLV
ncbi:MAG: family N-acetyltransferase [Sphingobacteriales bacterium]|nr:family N-acetyltransferase [Sphingobacteriales bacterium]